MAYYVSAIGGSRRVFAVGPFRRHGDALASVDTFNAWAVANIADTIGVGFGTAHNRAAHHAGRFNAQVGVTLDAQGFVEVAK